MADLHIFGGEKGGVGKSFVCRTAIEYHLHKNLRKISVFETDRSNDDVRRIYAKEIPVKLAIFSESEKFEDAANVVYNAAIEKRVLCNLPAQVFPAIRQWFEVNQLGELASDDGVTFYLWFVTDGGYDSLELLEKSLDFFGSSVRHILVKNWGRCDDFEALDDDADFQKLLAEHQVSVVDFPKCHGSKARNKIDKESLTFGEAASRDAALFDSINRSRINRFLTEAFAQFEQVGVFA